jgi:hypothetical protein
VTWRTFAPSFEMLSVYRCTPLCPNTSPYLSDCGSFYPNFPYRKQSGWQPVTVPNSSPTFVSAGNNVIFQTAVTKLCGAARITKAATWVHRCCLRAKHTNLLPFYVFYEYSIRIAFKSPSFSDPSELLVWPSLASNTDIGITHMQAYYLADFCATRSARLTF